MPLPRPDGKVGPSNDVVAHLDPDTLCHALWGSVTSSGSAAVRGTSKHSRLAGLQAGQQKYPKDLRIDAAMHTTTVV